MMDFRSLIVLTVLLTTPATFAQNGPPPTPVRVDAVRNESVQEQRRVTGELRPLRRSLVASRESGVVTDLGVLEGQRVAAGDVICRIDARLLELRLEEALADVALAEATHDERVAELGRATSDLEAIEALSQRDAVNPKELRDARSTVAIATARRLQAERAVGVIRSRVDLLVQRLDDTQIRAPFDGTVVTRRIELGQWLAEGGAVVELLSHGAIEAWLDVPQEFAAAVGVAVQSAEAVRIRIDASRSFIEPTSLRRVPAIDVRARTFPVIATIEDPDGMLAPGMSVTGWVPTGARIDRLTLRRDAIMVGPTGAFVYVVRGGGDGQPASVAPAQVDVLFEVGDRAAISTRDLRPGDLVVIEGNERLHPGARVTAVDAGTAEPATR